MSSDIHGRLGRLRASGKTAAATEKDPFKLSQALSTQSPASSQLRSCWSLRMIARSSASPWVAVEFADLSLLASISTISDVF